VIAANQAFPGTGAWSTWGTVTLTPALTAGAHTLKVWWDGPAGSNQYMNLDYLTVTGGTPPPSVPTVPTVPTNTAVPTITGAAIVGYGISAALGKNLA
jgi:hypothetical protein